MRLVRIPTGHSFGRNPFLGDVVHEVSPEQKANSLRMLIEGSAGEQKYRAEIDACMAKYKEAQALRMQSGGWSKLSDLTAGTDVMACLEEIESRLTAQLRPPTAQTPPPAPPVPAPEPPKQDLLPIAAGVGVVGIAIAILSTIK